MKRSITLTIVLVFVLSLAACGGNVDKNDASSYIGTWVSNKEYILTIKEGGAGEYRAEQGNVFSKWVQSYDLTYEIKDGIIYLTIDELVSSFELSDNGRVLTPIVNHLPVSAGDGTEFRKK